MTDLIAEIDALTRHSTSKAAMLLIKCRAEIERLRPTNDEWQEIKTLPLPIDHGTHTRAAEPVWLADAKGIVKLGKPLRRARDGLIGLFALDYHPTHWKPYNVPAPPPKKVMEPVP